MPIAKLEYYQITELPTVKSFDVAIGMPAVRVDHLQNHGIEATDCVGMDCGAEAISKERLLYVLS